MVASTAQPRSTLYLGLDYAAVKSGFELAGIKVDAGLWAGIRIMENEALKVLNGN